MSGRADRGLILATGTFTWDAKLEATRDGVPPIDLVDGEALIVKLRELGLGLVVQRVEPVVVDTEWFSRL
jgi:restriction system protein